MKNYAHIEKSGFRRGEYVAHCGGLWRVRKESGQWLATRQSDGAVKYEKTLDSLDRFFVLNGGA